MQVWPKSLGEHDSLSFIIRVLSELWVCLPTMHWHRKWFRMRGGDGDGVAMMVMMTMMTMKESLSAILCRPNKKNMYILRINCFVIMNTERVHFTMEINSNIYKKLKISSLSWKIRRLLSTLLSSKYKTEHK